MIKFLLLLSLLLSVQPLLLSAQESERRIRENFYGLAYQQALDIMRESWERWGDSRVLTAKDRYWGAILAYRYGQRERALRYFRQIASSKADNWLRESSKVWQAVITKEPVCKGKTTRGLSETAVALKERGNKHTWVYACLAIQQAAHKNEPLQHYWENLALTQPDNLRLWEIALNKSFAGTRTSPFFDPKLLQSLFAFWERAPEKRPKPWLAYVPGNGSLLSLTPNSVLHHESSFCIAKIRKELNARRGKELCIYLHRYRAALWGLAWLYARQGNENFRQGKIAAAHWHRHAAFLLYNMLFWPGYRGNWRHFDLTGIMQMSSLWSSMHRYEEMLTYVYTPTPAPMLEKVSQSLRPALQFLLAAQVTAKKPVIPFVECPQNPFALMWYEGAFPRKTVNDP